MVKFDQASFEDFCRGHQGDAPGSIRNAIHELLNMGIIVRANKGGQGKKAIYKLAFSPYK